jgi:tRNA A-37 threonylcarbamoyl transferase component Bud32
MISLTFLKRIHIKDDADILRCNREIELQTIASSYGFAPEIKRVKQRKNVCLISMQHFGNDSTLSDIYGDNSDDIPKWIWEKIRTMIEILYEEQNIEYVDITPYNFIEKDGKIYMIDFGDAYINESDGLVPSNWFLQEFLDGENKWNPDFT